tara:strand:+ start:444 stop:872 length:429 start_codon:yes stop_codon:yes gene_type:complete
MQVLRYSFMFILSGYNNMFAREKYINLRTFKKDFGAIDTPLWFVTFPDRPDKLFAFTNCMSGKIKRIKNNNAAEICACDYKGKPKTPWKSATVYQSEKASDYSMVISTCKKKYGWQMHLLEFFSATFNRRKNRAILEIQLRP